jgi:hypothetical protein
MSLLVILGAIALLFGALIIFIKIAAWVASNAESLTKLLFGVAVLLLIAASVAHFKPELVPQLTSVCNTVAESIRGFVKPFVA